MANTDLLSPQEKQEQAAVYMEKARNLLSDERHYEMGELPANHDKKSVSQSKWIINIAFMVFGIAGIVGSFWAAFDMIKYTDFLSVFAYIWGPLVVSVGGGRAFKNFVTKKYGPAEPPARPPM